MHQIIILLLLIKVSLTDWLKIDDSFTSSSISENNWSTKKDCNCSSSCSENFNKDNCDSNVNNLDYVKISKDRQKLYKQFTYKSYQTRILFDIFYNNADNGHDSILSVDYHESSSSSYNFFYTKKYRSGDLTQLSNRICVGGSDHEFDLYTYDSNAITNDATQFYFTFCLDQYSDGIYVGLRNVIVYANGCYPRCKTCNGANSNQCTSCYYGSLSGNSCTCNPNDQFAETQIGCRAECERDYSITNSNYICVTDRRIKSHKKYFDQSSISSSDSPRYQPFTFIPDPFHYQNTDLIFDGCSGDDFVGELFYNEGMSLQMDTINALKFMRLRLSFYLFSFQTNSKIEIFFDNVVQLELIKGATSFTCNTDSIIISTDTGSCNSQSYSLIRMETIVRTQTLNPLIVIQGQLKSSTESWGFRNVTIDAGLCKENCKVCSDFSTCSQCNSGYTLYQNGCVQSCPLYSYNCIDYVDEYPYSKYLIKGFYDLNMTVEEITSAYDSVNNPTTNFKTGQKFGFFPSKFVLGGVMVWQDATYTKAFSIPQAHYALTIRFNFTFGDEYPGNFYYLIDSTSYGPYTKPSGGQSSVGRDKDERIKFFYIYAPHSSTTTALNFELKCEATSGFDIRSGFCAISEYFVVCQPFCAACSSATVCSSWQGGHTSSSCASNEFLLFDSTTSTYSCNTCTQVGCLTCNSLEECTSCTYTPTNQFYLSNGVCYCYPFTFLSVSTCTSCNKYCENCYGSTQSNCLTCVSEFHRSISNNQCLCIPGYYDDGHNLPCLPICGDKLIVDGEDCDDGNYNPYDGCDLCQFSCDRECDVCAKGICESCINGYQLVENHCFAICNDGIQVTVEECDDNNLTPYDGCFNCQYSCSINCTNCVRGICQQCNESQGWYLQQDNTCQPICGDGIIVSLYEQCDDSNIDSFDKCSQCQYSCYENCDLCLLGQCTQCDSKYYLETKTLQCLPICGDNIQVETQVCDDDNNIPYDGCYKCNINCQSVCTKCTQNGCQECEKGWILNEIENNCESICGDGLVVGDEECDDESIVCVKCRLQCQDSCSQCYQGKCRKCQKGWNLNEFDQICYYISGDKYIVGDEQCDDSNTIDHDGCYLSQYSCQLSCKTCFQGLCQECYQGYFIINGKCFEINSDGLIVDNEICDDTNLVPFDGCFDNKYDCPMYCKYCVKGQCQQCKSNSGYGYLDQYNNQCLSICGDGIITFDEDCDDQNSKAFDGCFECQYSCPQECYDCVKGKCLQCNEGYYVNKKTNQCLSECGDMIVKQNEQCDDGNQDLTDGCAECKYVCHEQCQSCVEGKCMKCSGLGWQINPIIGDCQPICGDGIVIGNEQCDDGNEAAEDGCYECYFDCQKQCTKCVKGYCQECNTIGWELNWNYCIPTCGDKIVITDLEECDDGNTTPYDGCFECKFQCEEQCTDCKVGICYACNNKGWKIANNVCYAECGDGYVVPQQEECDDGNDIQFDGCYQCQYQCEQMCTTCQLGICYECDNLGWVIDNHICTPYCGDGLIVGYEQCDDQNTDFNDGCYNCMFACDQYCTDCQEGVCMQCEPGRYVEQNICEAVCGDGFFVETAESCDDGNDEKGDGCNKNCKVENDWVCVNNAAATSVCFYSQLPEFNLELVTTNPEDVEDVKITFTQQMKLSSKASSDINNLLTADITNVENSGFLITKSFDKTPTQDQTADLVISLKINFYVPVDQPVLIIKFLDDPLVSEYNLTLKASEGELQLLTPMVLSQAQKAAAESTQAFNEAVIYTLVGLSSLCVLTGSSDLFWNLMDQLQYLSYIKYINIAFPNNLNIYYEVFKLVTISPFMKTLGIDKIFNMMDGEQTYYIPAQNKFLKDEINAYFFTNFQSFLFVLFGGFSAFWATKNIYLFLYRLGPYYLSLLPFKLAKFLYGLRKDLKVKAKQFYYNGLLRILMSNCYDTSFACAIQLANFQGGDSVLVFNYYLAAIAMVTQGGVSLVLLGIMSNFINKATFKKKSEFDALFEGVLENKTTWIMQYNSLLLIKKQIFIFLIVFMQQDGQIQTLCIAFFQTIFLAYLLLNKPLTNQYEYYKSLITESLIIFNTITFLFYAYRVDLNLQLSDIINLGWIHIFTSTMILGVSLVFDFIQQAKILIQKLKNAIQGPQVERENTSVILFY